MRTSGWMHPQLLQLQRNCVSLQTEEQSHALVDRLAAYNQRCQLFSPDAPLLVMLSGGGDSVALLHLLMQMVSSRASLDGSKTNTVHVLHVNHQLRGEQADADEAFCQQLCQHLKLPLKVMRADVAAYAADNKLNVEDAGRILRYQQADQLMDTICDQQGLVGDAGRILTAHTRDDRVENFFTRAIFGSGLGGLAGMAARRGRVVRPLLDIDRQELRNWLVAQGYAWREDPSNDDLTKTRAFIRAQIVPQAEKLRPNFRENLARTMDLVADDDRLLSDMALGFAQDFCIQREIGVSVTLDPTLVLTLDSVMARRVLRCAITQTFEDASRLDASHLQEIMGGLESLGQMINAGEKVPPKKTIYARDIPPALRVQITCDKIKITRICASN